MHDHDLHPRAEQTGLGRPKPIGFSIADKEAARNSELGQQFST
jgi:hypothetical protein